MQNWKKKIMILGLSVSLVAGGLYGCGNTDTEETTEKTEGTSGESQETVEKAEGSSQAQIEKPETKKALLRGAPMVAQPRATPFLRGNQSAIRVGATKLNPEAKKQTTIKSST